MDTGIGEPTETTERTCLICGCTDSKSCEGGCGWVVMLGGKIDVCTKCITDKVPECIDLLVACISATHLPEIDAVCGDDSCITCELIKFARKVEKALRQ